jgi:hypothetical protein
MSDVTFHEIGTAESWDVELAKRSDVVIFKTEKRLYVVGNTNTEEPMKKSKRWHLQDGFIFDDGCGCCQESFPIDKIIWMKGFRVGPRNSES